MRAFQRRDDPFQFAQSLERRQRLFIGSIGITGAFLIALLDAPVYLDLHVKVLANWRSDDRLMKRLGYRVPKERDDR